MRLRRTFCLCALLALAASPLLGPACSSDPAPPDPHYRGTGMALSVDIDGGTDVAGFVFHINRVSCNNQPFTPFSTTVAYDLEDVRLSMAPFVAGSAHLFSDAFVVLEAGCYDVLAQPVTLQGAPSADCSLAAANDIVITDGQTTEAVLISQCGVDTQQGALDVIAALNHPPELVELTFDPSKWVAFCEAQTVCATFRDPDADPLDIVWEQLGGLPLLAPIAVLSTTPNLDGSLTQCVGVQHAGVGKVDLRVTAYDQMATPPPGSGMIRFEDYFAQQGLPYESHDSLTFPSYGNPSAACPCSQAPNPEICDGLDNDCDGAVDEDGCGVAACADPNLIWYFGAGSGLDFNNAAPAPVSGNPFTAHEGSAVMTCGNQILVTTNGKVAYDAASDPMPNGSGLNGCGSATQAALVVPRPGASLDELFLFTVADWEEEGLGELRYSVVDMTLRNGLGDVDPQRKSIALSPGVKVTEKLSSVRHWNGTDTWVIVHGWQTDQLHAYQVSASGVSGPVVSHVGPVHGLTRMRGQLKASPDGAKLASGSAFALDLYDFDRATGAVSNHIEVIVPCLLYGVEFSSNSSLLYGSCHGPGTVYQYNLAAGTAAGIAASQTALGQTAGVTGGAMQRGPDGRIYVAAWGQADPATGTHHLSTIDQPNVIGSGAGFTQLSVPLNGILLHGLPSVVAGSY